MQLDAKNFDIKKIQSMNPTDMLTGLNYNLDDQAKLLNGDIDPIIDKFISNNKQMGILDIDSIQKYYMKSYGIEYLKWLFTKNKLKYTIPEEKDAKVQNALFNICIDRAKASSFAYNIEQIPEQNVAVDIKINDDVYTMCRTENFDFICYKGEYNEKQK